jgi:ABC-type glycerol-3-phosphate transport system permease component
MGAIARTAHMTGASRWVVRPSSFLAILITFLAFLLCGLWMYPLACTVGMTFNRVDAVMTPLVVFPKIFTWEVYHRLVSVYHMQDYFLNTLNVAFCSALLTVLSATMAGYALGKMRFRGRDTIFIFVLATMLLPAQATMAPTFVLYKKLHLINTHLGLILPALGGGAWNIFLMRQFMLRTPDELLDAGRIDGCNEMKLFYRIVLPNTVGPVLVLATLAVNGAWTQLIAPQIFILDLSKQLIMPAILSIYGALAYDPYGLVTTVAAAFVATILPVALYSYSQRHFMSAIAGAIKG